MSFLGRSSCALLVFSNSWHPLPNIHTSYCQCYCLLTLLSPPVTYRGLVRCSYSERHNLKYWNWVNGNNIKMSWVWPTNFTVENPLYFPSYLSSPVFFLYSASNVEENPWTQSLWQDSSSIFCSLNAYFDPKLNISLCPLIQVNENYEHWRNFMKRCLNTVTLKTSPRRHFLIHLYQ